MSQFRKLNTIRLRGANTVAAAMRKTGRNLTSKLVALQIPEKLRKKVVSIAKRKGISLKEAWLEFREQLIVERIQPKLFKFKELGIGLRDLPSIARLVVRNGYTLQTAIQLVVAEKKQA